MTTTERAAPTDLAAVKNDKASEVPDENWLSGISVRAAEQMLADVAEVNDPVLPKP